MESLAEAGWESALTKVAAISLLRLKGSSEDEAAEKAGFRGAGHMRQELEWWGFPAWFVEGGAPPTPSKKPEPPKRRAKGSGPAKELPPASNATPLFREKLEALSRANEELRRRKEKLQGGRFQQSAVYTDPAYIPRKLIPEGLWEQLCESHDLDPEDRGFYDPTAKTWVVGDGTPAPQAPLPALIAAYVLAEGDLEPLLSALYPGVAPPEVRDQIRKCVDGKKDGDKRDGLRVVAQQLAKLVRGGEVRRGRDPADLTRDDINLACRITEERKAGVPDPEIFQKLRRDPRLKELTWDEFCRLRDLNLEWPFRQ